MAVINQTRDFLAWGADPAQQYVGVLFGGGNWFAVTGSTNLVMFEFLIDYVQEPLSLYARLVATVSLEPPIRSFPLDREHSYVNGFEERRDLILRRRMPSNSPFCFTFDKLVQGLIYKLQLRVEGGDQVAAQVWGHLGTS